MFKALSNYLRTTKLFNPINLGVKYPKDFLALMKSNNYNQALFDYISVTKSNVIYYDCKELEDDRYEFKVELSPNKLTKIYVANTVAYPEGSLHIKIRYSDELKVYYSPCQKPYSYMSGSFIYNNLLAFDLYVLSKVEDIATITIYPKLTYWEKRCLKL